MMTDEQYIDWLFNEEPCDTPGFRDFLLELMATIGERPRAGDVAQMHLAFCAGREAPPDWTTDRPTEPGEYWLSLPPDDRQSMPRVRPAYVYESRRCMVTLNFDAPDAYEPVLVVGGSDETSSVWPDSADQCIDINDTVLDGALWAPRETPADPFQEVAR